MIEEDSTILDYLSYFCCCSNRKKIDNNMDEKPQKNEQQKNLETDNKPKIIDNKRIIIIVDSNYNSNLDNASDETISYRSDILNNKVEEFNNKFSNNCSKIELKDLDQLDEYEII